MRDIVLVTVDCWRHDAVERMPELRGLADGYARTEAICQAPATRGAFPALLASRYYPETYVDFDTIRPGVRALPDLLSEAGYATCGVCGSNPFLTTWGDRFDAFWNDGLADDPGGLAGTAATLRRLRNYLRLRGRVTATDVAARARRWYESTDGPRFLWMHLMDAHVPFLPGLSRALDEGLADTVRVHRQFRRDPGALTADDRRTLRRLYRRSIEHLDAQLPAVLGVPDDDALVLVVGDHGEEFDHGAFGHARLYDECVRVPLLANPALREAADGFDGPLAQLDVPATLLDAVDRPVPDDWAGQPAGAGDPWPAFMLNHSPRLERAYAGVRTARYKLVRTFDERLVELETAGYDLAADPGERVDVHGEDGALDPLERHLDAFLGREEIRSGILERSDYDVPGAVADRLSALGYR